VKPPLAAGTDGVGNGSTVDTRLPLTRVEATRSYTAADGTQLSVSKGDVFDLLKSTNADWVRCWPYDSASV
jgi:hypothetical protein